MKTLANAFAMTSTQESVAMNVNLATMAFHVVKVCNSDTKCMPLIYFFFVI